MEMDRESTRVYRWESPSGDGPLLFISVWITFQIPTVHCMHCFFSYIMELDNIISGKKYFPTYLFLSTQCFLLVCLFYRLTVFVFIVVFNTCCSLSPCYRIRGPACPRTRSFGGEKESFLALSLLSINVDSIQKFTSIVGITCVHHISSSESLFSFLALI